MDNDFSESVLPGAFLEDSLPIMKYLPDWCPGTGYRAIVKERLHTRLRARDEAFNMVKEQLARGTASPSLVAELLENNPNRTHDEDMLFRDVTNTFYAGAADTTVSAIESFFLIMCIYPELQRKAQTELDGVVTPGHLPTFADRQRLPYIDALIKEVHRWNPVGPTGVPHKVMEDDVYKGFRIPAGATVIGNSWQVLLMFRAYYTDLTFTTIRAILHDPALYPDYFEVIPDRYLQTKDNGLNPNPRKFVFGYGRRVCPGQMLAEDSLYIVAVLALSTLSICCTDLQGQSLPNEVEYDGAVVRFVNCNHTEGWSAHD
ncbi:cytochrome P450 [Wolfiporia cocos MD-104 SS10]|uniref:Cytochrome P450 n=1 Tax=Wolfiporia cocos (strain MD-104) TaxID=742152 RepID=A0A2H3J8Y3_WOLCO|nr:cytochrome P450 [Wolfiporia cocos MD-104 SS10]